MGTSKALLRLHGRTFVERVTQALAAGGCDPVIVVVGEGEQHEQAGALAERLGARLAVNPRPDSEQIDSLRVALEHLPPGARGAMVTPVDVPLVSAALVAALISAFDSGDFPLVLPEREGRHGHPVLFGRDLLPELSSTDLRDGARSVVHAHLPRAGLVSVSDSMVLNDVDTRESYGRLLDR